MGTRRRNTLYALYRRTNRVLRRVWRRVYRHGRRFVRRQPVLAAVLLAGLVMIGTVSATRQPEEIRIQQKAYAPLLDTIAKGESGGNYNAHYGNAGNTGTRFTDMTVAEVLRWQEEYVGRGSPSSAVGKYQIIRPTLMGLVRQLGVDLQARFDEAMQDRLAVALLERRGSHAYIKKQLSRDQFAANLAKEWAALPKIEGENPHESYYAGDGLNSARISIDEVYAALAAFEKDAMVYAREDAKERITDVFSGQNLGLGL